jgi:hypothetical protein
MRQLKLMAEVQCWPLWQDEPDAFDNVDPATLGLSARLLEQLTRWTDRWDAQYDLQGRPPAIEWAAGEFERFDQEGMELWKDLQQELNGRYRVVYDSYRQGRILADPLYTCPVCGYPELDEPPRTQSGGGSYEICPACGFEFGWTDEDQGYTYEQWRAKWIAEGMRWDRGQSVPPSGWDPVSQLRNIGVDLPSGSAEQS